MTSHIHMITGTHGEMLEKIMHSLKKHTCERLKAAIKDRPGENRRAWIMDLMTEAGKKNCHNRNFQL